MTLESEQSQLSNAFEPTGCKQSHKRDHSETGPTEREERAVTVETAITTQTIAQSP